MVGIEGEVGAETTDALVASAEQAAWAIAISLARHGMKPKPFFFKQIPIVREKFQKRVKQILDEL